MQDQAAPTPRPVEPLAQASMLEAPDPVPSGLSEVGRLDSGGGSAGGGGVTVLADTGAITDGDQVVVSVAESLGVIAGERWGVPVEVVHGEPLSAPLTVSWDLGDLDDAARAGLMLVRWDPETSAWAPQALEYRVEGESLSAEIGDFSIWTWVSNNVADLSAGVGQEVGEVIGKRTDEPTCDGELHSWVRQVVSPSEDLEAAAIGVCFEPDRDDIVTVRVSNNRTFTQMMTMTTGGQQWAWTWGGQEWVGIEQAAYGTARLVFDSDTRYLLPPLHEVAVGVARPDVGGKRVVATEATVSPESLTVDVMAYLLESLPIGGLTNPTLNSAVQALYACAGKQLLGGGFSAVDGAVRVVVDAMSGCARQISEDPQFFAGLVGGSAQQIKSARAVRYLTTAATVLRYADLAFYTSDQIANAFVGPLSWTIRGDGRAASLGDWAATCTAVDTDSNRLWRNLALRDEFADTSVEYHDFPRWAPAAEQAITPLQECSPAYRAQLASQLASTWGDTDAARIVADLLDTGPDGRQGTEVVWVKPTEPSSELKSDYTVAASISGASCNYGSNYISTHGHRCFADSTIYDPCWYSQDPASDVSSVVCLANPWDTSVIRLVGLADLTGGDEFPSGLPPWGVELSSGERCRAVSGARSDAFGQPVDYICQDGVKSVLRDLDTSSATWTGTVVALENGGHVNLGRESLRRVWVSGDQAREEGVGPYPGEARLGDTGPVVLSWQTMLITAGVISDYPENRDGVYGPGTQGAVRDFESRVGLAVDGVADEDLWRYLVEVVVHKDLE